MANATGLKNKKTIHVNTAAVSVASDITQYLDPLAGLLPHFST